MISVLILAHGMAKKIVLGKNKIVAFQNK